MDEDKQYIIPVMVDGEKNAYRIQEILEDFLTPEPDAIVCTPEEYNFFHELADRLEILYLTVKGWIIKGGK